jgi:hypothetical protein
MNIKQIRPVLAVATALVLTGGFAIDAATAAAAPVANATAQASQNWAGYVASGRSFSSVTGSWVEPTVNANSDGYSAFWVGLGGASQDSQALEQIGTAADVQNGQTTYYAWYELVPNPETKLDLAVHPGDRMTGTVTVNGTTVTLSLSDQTTGQSVTKTLQDSSPDTSSAEWIAEAPSAQTGSGGYRVLPLADFGTVTFTNAAATADGHTGSISDSNWTVQPVDLSASSTTGLPGGRFAIVGAGGRASSTAGASTSNLTGDGSSFSVSYAADGGNASQATGTGGYLGDGYGGGYPGYGYGGGYPGYGDGGGTYYVIPGGYYTF